VKDNLSVEQLPRISNHDLKLFWATFEKSGDFDQNSFLQLFNDTNDETVMKILARFHETLTTSESQIELAIEPNDVETVWKACHKVSGSAEMLGFRGYGNVARELSKQLRANPELASHSSDIDEFLQLTHDLRRKITLSCPNLSSFLS